MQDALGILHRRLVDVDLLKPPAERLVALERRLVFRKGGGADAAQFAAGQGGLEQVRRIHHAAFDRSGAHDGVDFVDKQDGAGLVPQGFQHRLEALLELAAVLRAGDQGAHVEGVDLGAAQRVRHLAALDPEGEALGNGRLADARLADKHRVVLAAAAQHLNGTADFGVAPDKRVDAVVLGQFDQVDREGGQGIGRRAAGAVPSFPGFEPAFRLAALFPKVAFGNAVGDVIQHVEPADTLPGQQVNGVGARLREHRRQHVAGVDHPLARPLRLQ